MKKVWRFKGLKEEIFRVPKGKEIWVSETESPFLWPISENYSKVCVIYNKDKKIYTVLKERGFDKIDFSAIKAIQMSDDPGAMFLPISTEVKLEYLKIIVEGRIAAWTMMGLLDKDYKAGWFPTQERLRLSENNEE